MKIHIAEALGNVVRRRRTPARALVLLLLASILVPADAAQATGNGGLLATVCYVPSAAPRHEQTVTVPALAVGTLLRASLSYSGPCASYGESASLGNGTLTAYSQVEDSVPKSIGMVFTSSTLDGLPYDPPSDGMWCFDRNADGVVDQHTECSGGYEHALQLSAAFKSKVDTPFTYVLANWNPMGHIPMGVWNVPHFDVHFYTNDNAERLAIRPGPCPVLVNCGDYEIGKIQPASKYVAPDYSDVDAVEPAMGNHLVDQTSPEFHGNPFTHTFLYGIWGGHITFYEPMVTHAWYSGLRYGTNTDACFPMKLPQAWEHAGWYPTRYCLRYRANRDELTTSLEDFVYRQAG
jgi:hypothetical protein